MLTVLIYVSGNKPSFSARFGPVGRHRLELSAHFCSLKAFIASTKMWCSQYSHAKFRYLMFTFYILFHLHSFFSKFSRLWRLFRPLAGSPRPRGWLSLAFQAFPGHWLGLFAFGWLSQASWLAFPGLPSLSRPLTRPLRLWLALPGLVAGFSWPPMAIPLLSCASYVEEDWAFYGATDIAAPTTKLPQIKNTYNFNPKSLLT